MNIYHIWCNLRDGVRDLDFTDAAQRYFDHLRTKGLIDGYRITRRKLGLGPATLPEFHIMVETASLEQLDRLFLDVASRGEPIDGLHRAVNAKAKDVLFGLYRDVPDDHRRRGEETF